MTSDATVDAREVEFYSRLADSWWRQDGPLWPLHKLNALRTDYIVDRLCRQFELRGEPQTLLSGLRVLDVGCGGGILSESLARRAARVVGIDVVEKNIKVAALHAAEQDLAIDYRVATAAELAGEGATFDVVLNMEVVEHVADVDAFMHDCVRLTGPNGVMFVATINRTLLAWLFAIVGAEYVLRWLPRGTHRWSRFQKPAELTTCLSRGGITVRESVGVSVNPFTRGFRLTDSTAVNYMMFCSRSP